MIVVLFGQPHSGKTTLGELVRQFAQLKKHTEVTTAKRVV
jgi:adenylate kinase family enzyme